MRSLLCVVACLAVAASASAQTVVVSPNTIHGQIGFDNTDPGVLAVLQSSGLAFVAESAYSTSPSGYSTNGYAYVTGSPTLSPYSLSGEADGNQGHVTYNLQVSGGLNQRPGYSTGAAQYQFGTKQVDLLPVGQQPDGISLDFIDTVTVHRIRFGTDSTCNTLVSINGGDIKAINQPAYLGITTFYAGTDPQYFFVPNRPEFDGMTQDVEVTLGTDPTKDTFNLTFPSIDFSPQGDTVVDHCLVVPTGNGAGTLGEIDSPLGIAGYPVVAGYITGIGPGGNQRFEYLTKNDSFDNTGAVDLINLVPGDWQVYATLTSGAGQTKRQYNIGPTPNIPVSAGQVTDGASNGALPFSMNPILSTGNIRVLDDYARTHPGSYSSLDALNFEADYNVGFGFGWGTSLHGNSQGYTSTSVGSFSGRYNPSIGELDSTYVLPMLSLYDQPMGVATRPSLQLTFSSPQDYYTQLNNGSGDNLDPATFRNAQMTLLSAGYVQANPGQQVSADWALCTSEVTVIVQSTTGQFVNPQVSANLPYNTPTTITDLDGNQLSYTGNVYAVGTPQVGRFNSSHFLAHRASQGQIIFPLTQGNWTITPSATFISDGGQSSTGNFAPIHVNIQGCGQRVVLVPGLDVTVDPINSCIAPTGNGHEIPISGTLTATNATVDHAWYTVNGGAPVDLCNGDCGATYSATTILPDGNNTIVVYASSQFVTGTPQTTETISCSPNGCGVGCNDTSCGATPSLQLENDFFNVNYSYDQTASNGELCSDDHAYVYFHWNPGCAQPFIQSATLSYLGADGQQHLMSTVNLSDNAGEANTEGALYYDDPGPNLPAPLQLTMTIQSTDGSEISQSVSTPGWFDPAPLPAITCPDPIDQYVDRCGHFINPNYPQATLSGECVRLGVQCDPITSTSQTQITCSGVDANSNAQVSCTTPVTFHIADPAQQSLNLSFNTDYSPRAPDGGLCNNTGLGGSYDVDVGCAQSGQVTQVTYVDKFGATRTTPISQYHSNFTPSSFYFGLGELQPDGTYIFPDAPAGDLPLTFTVTLNDGTSFTQVYVAPATETCGCQSVEQASGQVMFEDLWSSNGDLDFNDQNVAYQYRIARSADTGRLTKFEASFNFLSLGAQLHNGLYLHLPGIAADQVATITRTTSDGATKTLTVVSGESEAIIPITNDSRELFPGQTGYINTQDGSAQVTGLAVSVLVEFTEPLQYNAITGGAAPLDLFIARSDDYSHQVHLSQFPGSDRMDTALFGTGDDNSYTGASGTPGVYFVNHNGLPFALAVPSTIPWAKERSAIDSYYPSLTDFATSGGQTATDWYTQPGDSSNAYDDGQPNLDWLDAGPNLERDYSGCHD